MKTATQTELGAILGLSTRQIRNLEKKGLPCVTEGRRKFYPLPASVHWWRDVAISRALEPYSSSDLEAERVRWLAAKASRAELELANLRGELVPLDDVQGMLHESFEAIALTLRSSPALTAPDLAEASSITLRRARLILEDMVEIVKTQIRNEIRRY